ncbi:MAG: MinD/ParA family protein [Phycisphaerae bacterium]
MTVLDQATRLRQIARRVQPHAQTIAITSGKGGVGKTNLAANLAATLASMQRRVILLDADLGLANADILCNVQPRYNLAHVVAGQRTLDEVIAPVPLPGLPSAQGMLSLIAGASGLARMADLPEADRALLVEQLEMLPQAADVVIIDTGAGIGRNVLSFAAPADHVTVVTTPEPTAITDAYAVIKVLARAGATGKISIMVNQVRSRDEARIVHERIASVTRQFLGADISFAGYVVSDPVVPLSVRKRACFVAEYPNSAAAQCIRAWANRIDHNVDVAAYAVPAPRSFFSRLAGWWR